MTTFDKFAVVAIFLGSVTLSLMYLWDVRMVARVTHTHREPEAHTQLPKDTTFNTTGMYVPSDFIGTHLSPKDYLVNP